MCHELNNQYIGMLGIDKSQVIERIFVFGIRPLFDGLMSSFGYFSLENNLNLNSN